MRSMLTSRALIYRIDRWSLCTYRVFRRCQNTSAASTAVVERKKVQSWVQTAWVTPEFEPGHKMRPVAYSERRLRREYNFPDSPINDVFLNMFLGKIVYDHCFPYHILTKPQHDVFARKLNSLQQFMKSQNLEETSSNQEVLSAFRKAGLLGIRTNAELGGLGISFERELLRFSECLLDYTEDAELLKHAVIQNVIQMCIAKYVLNDEVSKNLRTLINEEITAEFVVFGNANVKKFDDGWMITSDEQLEKFGQLNDKVPELLLCVAKDSSKNKNVAFLVTTADNEGSVYKSDSKTFELNSCPVSSALTIENGDDLIDMFHSFNALCIGALVSKWAKRLTSELFLDVSRRRRYGYRMIKYQNIMSQIEEIEKICYAIETLPYFSAAKMDRARDRFKQEPPKMLAEIRSGQILQHRYALTLTEKLSCLGGLSCLGNQSFNNFVSFAEKEAYPNIESTTEKIANEGMKLYVESLTNKELQHPFRHKVRQFYFNNIIHAASNNIESMLSDPNMVFLHNNFMSIANSVDKSMYEMFKILKQARKERPETFHEDEFVKKIITEFSLSMHLVIVMLARSTQSTFAGNPHYHHESRFVEKFVWDLLQDMGDMILQWSKPGAFEAASVVAEHAKSNIEVFKDVLSWTEVK